MSTQRTVVIVDDEPLLVRVLSEVFRCSGCDVLGFTDPREALTFLQNNAVALVLCDQRMPGMTGLELLEQLERDVPFYLFSGDLAFGPHALGPRVAGVVAKPARSEDLLALAVKHGAMPD